MQIKNKWKKKLKKKQKIEKVEMLKNQSWKNKVEIWRIENLKTIVSNENLKRKLQFKKVKKSCLSTHSNGWQSKTANTAI